VLSLTLGESLVAAHGAIFRGEEIDLLDGIADDPRLSTALWRTNPDLAEPLVTVALRRTDLWRGTMVLIRAMADLWLGRVLKQAAATEVAAVAMVLSVLESVMKLQKWRCHTRLRIGTISNKVPQEGMVRTPLLLGILKDGLQSLQVCVNIGHDRELHFRQ
jgi:hypothetical protein